MVDADVDLLGSELVDALGLAQEHNLQLGALGVIIDVLGELLVDRVVLDGDVDCNSGLQVDDVGLECVDLMLAVLQLLEQFETRGVFSVDLRLQVQNVLTRLLEVPHHLVLLRVLELALAQKHCDALLKLLETQLGLEISDFSANLLINLGQLSNRLLFVGQFLLALFVLLLALLLDLTDFLLHLFNNVLEVFVIARYLLLKELVVLLVLLQKARQGRRAVVL